jgi:hypothetical protein
MQAMSKNQTGIGIDLFYDTDDIRCTVLKNADHAFMVMGSERLLKQFGWLHHAIDHQMIHNMIDETNLICIECLGCQKFGKCFFCSISIQANDSPD